MGFDICYIDVGCRKKKHSESRVKKVVSIPAIDEGDLWTWRKYGQKDILGSRFPRYTHVFLYIHIPIFVYILYSLQT